MAIPCWYLKMLKFALPPNANFKICVTPNAKVTNEISRVGHVHFMFFVLISLRWVPNANAFSVEYGL